MGEENEGGQEGGWLGLPAPVRWLIRYALMAVVSLTLGTVLEHVAEGVKHNAEQAKESFAKAEQTAIASVGRLRPTALSRLYATALQPKPSPLLAADQKVFDDAEAAIARVRANQARSPGAAALATPVVSAEALRALSNMTVSAPSTSGSLSGLVNSLPPPTGAAARYDRLSAEGLGSNSTSELAKALQDTPGAVRPVTRYADRLEALHPGTPATPDSVAPPSTATRPAGGEVTPPPAAVLRLPSAAATSAAVTGLGGAPAFDRLLKVPATLGNPDAGPSPEEQALGVKLHHWAGTGRGNWLSPGTALADVLWTLATRGAWAGRVVMILQLLFGIACAAPLLAWLGEDKRLGGGGGPLLIIAGPFAVVGFGSLISLAVWALMAGAHALFGGFSHVPGLSIGLGTAGFCCWHVGWRGAELALGHPIERLIERV